MARSKMLPLESELKTGAFRPMGSGNEDIRLKKIFDRLQTFEFDRKGKKKKHSGSQSFTGMQVQGSLVQGRASRTTDFQTQSSDECPWTRVWAT